MGLSSGYNEEGAWMSFRAIFLTRPDLDSNHLDLPEGLALGGEIDVPQEASWRLVEIETRPQQDQTTLIFEPDT
jgi:hypothetical protein